jgi:pyruvate dehydrogenase E1 component alpha subunit
MDQMAAEIMGKATGMCGGKGGSMHVADFSVGMLGCNGIVGGGIGIVAGAAFSAKYRGTDQVAVAFFGDGATNIGAFHEALNLAAVWKLPVIFICENNLYMEYTPIGAVTAADHPAADRAPSYRMAAQIVDGNDVTAVRDVVAQATERARAGEGPTIIEAETYRHYGHSRTDPATYRPAEEVERWLKHDPIDVARARLESLGVTPDQIKDIDERASAEVAAAIAAAKAAPAADVAEAFTDVWADGGAAWRV